VTTPLRRVLVVGTGLIGTSVGLALRRRGVDVLLRDIDARRLAEAGEAGAGRPDVPARSPGPDLVDNHRPPLLAWNEDPVDLAVVAVPPAAVAGVLADLLDSGRATTVTDVASVKAPIRDAVATHPARHTYVGGHPMAGREVSGPAGARPDLFRGRPWVVCPTPDSEPAAVERVTELAVLAGATPITLDPDDHDEAVALVSHVPHAVSALVAGRLGVAAQRHVRLAGPGVGDMTRIAASDPSLWTEILAANADAVSEVLREVRADLDTLLAALEQGATAQVGALLTRGVAGRARLPGKHGGDAVPFAVVPVLLSDRPGQLARLFADVGGAGINVEDLHLEHVPGEPVGVVALEVAADAAPRLRSALLGLGWTLQD